MPLTPLNNSREVREDGDTWWIIEVFSVQSDVREHEYGNIEFSSVHTSVTKKINYLVYFRICTFHEVRISFCDIYFILDL